MRFRFAEFGVLAALIGLVTIAIACGLSAKPHPGLARFRSQWIEEVRGYEVDLAGGNGRYTIEVFRNGMDSHLGTYSYSFTYNSADEGWSSEFGMSYRDGLLVDDSGGRYDLAKVLDGFPVPGTHWVRLSSSAIRSRGGRRYEFSPQTGELVGISLGDSSYPRLDVGPDLVQQCQSSSWCEDLFIIARDANGHAVEITSRDRSAQLAWTSSGQLSLLRQSGDVEAGRAGYRFEYQQGGLLTAVDNPANERIQISYSGRRVSAISQIGEGDPTHHFEYGTTTISGAVRDGTVVIDPRGGERTVAYTVDLRVEAERNQVGETTEWSWLDMEIVSRTEPDGSITTWQRSGIVGEILSETQPSGNLVVTHHEYYGVNPLDHREHAIAHRSDSLGLIGERTYDSLGRLSSSTDAEGHREEFAYDVVGSWGALEEASTHAEVDPLITRLLWHGWHGHPTQLGVYDPLGTIYRERVYSEAGDLLKGDDKTAEAPGLPGVVENRYDHNRYLAEKQLDFGTPTTVVRVNRFDGQIETVTRPYGGDTSFEYDALGRPVSHCDVVDGANQCTTTAYDLNSNVVLITRGDGSTESRAYDAANREISRTYTKPGTAEMTLVGSWRDDRLEWTEDSAYGMQRDSFEYDSSGEISAIDFHDAKRMEIVRDLRGRVTELTLLAPEGQGTATAVTLGWAYDGVDRPTHLYENGSLLVQDSYESNRLVGRWTANGNHKNWQYASSWFGGQLEETSTYGPMISASSVIQREAGEWAVRTNLTGLSTGAIVDLEELHHTTDPLAPADLGVFVTGWGEDAEFAYTPELSYSYDALGNLLFVAASPTSTHPSSQITWNDEHNRVVSALYDGQTIQYVYNAAGEVIERGGLTVARNAMGAVVGHGLWWAEKDTQGRFVSVAGQPRVFGGTVEADSGGNPTAMDLPSVRIEFAPGSNSHYFKYRDFRGNLQRVDDDSGAPVVLYHYDPFGVADVFGTPADMAEHTFAGGLAFGSGLVLTGRRVLDPACKCYWSNDPVFSTASQIAYTQNPLDLWDPTGEEASSAGAGAMAGGSVVIAAAVGATGAAAVAAWAVGLGLIGFGIYLTLFA